MRGKNLTEDCLLALAIAVAVAAEAARRQYEGDGQPWQVQKYARFREDRGGIRVTLGMQCLPRVVDILVRMSSGNTRRCTFDGTITWPDAEETKSTISGSASRSFEGAVTLENLEGVETRAGARA